jgi:hypothetical protein
MSASTQLFGIQNSSKGIGYSYARMPAGVWTSAGAITITSGAITYDGLSGTSFGDLDIDGTENAREMWSPADPTKFFVPITGWYSLSLAVRHASAAGIDLLFFQVDGVTPARVTWASQVAENCENSADWIYPLVAGQVVTFQVTFPASRASTISEAQIVLLSPGY